jgi:hypothetical protein
MLKELHASFVRREEIKDVGRVTGRGSYTTRPTLLAGKVKRRSL